MPKNGVGEIGETRITPYITRSRRPSTRRRRGPPGAPVRLVEGIVMVLPSLILTPLPIGENSQFNAPLSRVCRAPSVFVAPAADNNDEWRMDPLAAVMNSPLTRISSALN